VADRVVSMVANPARILCLGRDVTLQETRCAVLIQSGYNAQAASIPEGYQQLRDGFDLVVVSTRLLEQNGDEFLRTLPSETPILEIKAFLYPREMLAAVADLLASKPRRNSLLSEREQAGSLDPKVRRAQAAPFGGRSFDRAPET
jgi:hypothetical protein